MTAAERKPSFLIEWRHDGARQLAVFVDADLPEFSPLENRTRGIATVASSRAGLRLLLASAFSDQWLVTVLPTVGGLTTVRMVPIR